MGNNSSSAGIHLFTIPQNARPSERFRERFNAVAKDLGVDVQWVKDEKNPLAVDADEIQSTSSYTDDDIRKVCFRAFIAILVPALNL